MYMKPYTLHNEPYMGRGIPVTSDPQPHTQLTILCTIYM